MSQPQNIQAPVNPNGNPNLQLSQGSYPSNTSPMQMPSQSQMSNPYGNADTQTIQMIDNMKAMQQSGAFLTPDQRARMAHPIMSRISDGMMAFGQGLTHQPFYTQSQQSQADLQNTQEQGINAISTLPAQLRMMMAMNQMAPAQGNIPGAPQPGIASLQPAGSPQGINMQELIKNAPKGATHFSPSMGYLYANGNPVK